MNIPKRNCIGIWNLRVYQEGKIIFLSEFFCPFDHAYIYVVRMDIEDRRKGIYLFKGNGSWRVNTSVSHHSRFTFCYGVAPRSADTEKQDIYGASSISYHNSEIQN